jgi:hypothetical protein
MNNRGSEEIYYLNLVKKLNLAPPPKEVKLKSHPQISTLACLGTRHAAFFSFFMATRGRRDSGIAEQAPFGCWQAESARNPLPPPQS